MLQNRIVQRLFLSRQPSTTEKFSTWQLSPLTRRRHSQDPGLLTADFLVVLLGTASILGWSLNIWILMSDWREWIVGHLIFKKKEKDPSGRRCVTTSSSVWVNPIIIEKLLIVKFIQVLFCQALFCPLKSLPSSTTQPCLLYVFYNVLVINFTYNPPYSLP